MFALRAFREGDFIFRRKHTHIGNPESVSEADRVHLCQVGIDRWALVVPPGCYMNHCCEPNALRRGVKVVAWKAISPGDEITLDYRLNAIGGSAWPCRCGAPSCCGVVDGGFFGLRPEQQLELLPFAGEFVRAEYRRRTDRR